MSVIGYKKNALNLIKSYCKPNILYECETGHLDNNDYHRLNVIWNNNLFGKILDVAGVKMFLVCCFIVRVYLWTIMAII